MSPRGSLGEALAKFAASVANERRRITMETVQAVLDNGRILIRGREVGLTGEQPIRTGMRIPVAWEKDNPVVAYAGTGLFAQFAPGGVTGTSVGIVEKLFIARGKDGTRDVYFRSPGTLMKLGVVAFLGGEPSTVKWGADRKSFAAATGTGNTRKWGVFRFTGKSGSSPLQRGQSSGPARGLRLYDPSMSAMPVVTVKATRTLYLTAMAAGFQNNQFQQEWIQIIASVLYPATGQGVHWTAGSNFIGKSAALATTATETLTLERLMTLGDLLRNALTGVDTTITDYYVDRDGHLILSLAVTFTPSTTGDGNRTRTGTIPAVRPDPDDYCSFRTEDASTPASDLNPLGPQTNKMLSPYLAERHAFVVDVTAGAVLFKTTRDAPTVTDDVEAPTSAMDYYNPFGGGRSRWQQQYRNLLVINYLRNLDGAASTTSSQMCGPIPNGLADPFDPNPNDYANCLRRLLDFEAVPAVTGSGNPIIYRNYNIDLNDSWPRGNVGGIKTACGDLWDHTLPWASDLVNLGPLPEDISKRIDNAIIAGAGSYIYGFNQQSYPPSKQGMDASVSYLVCKYSTSAFETRAAIPIGYRVLEARVLSLGAAATPATGRVWLSLERVTNSGTTEAPVWAKQVGIYVVTMGGVLVSNPLPWLTISTQNNSGAGWVKDPLQNFYDDGTRIDVLAESAGHVIYAISTLPQRTANPNACTIRLVNVATGAAKVVGGDLTKYQAPALVLLGIDLLYRASEPKPLGRKFVTGWDFETGRLTLDAAAKGFPVPDPALAALGDLQELGGLVPLASHYHGLNDRTSLAPAKRFRAESTNPYPVS